MNAIVLERQSKSWTTIILGANQMVETLSGLLAYIDPGTGAIVVQVLIAGALSVGVFFRRLLIAPFSMIASLFSGGRNDTAATGDSTDSGEPPQKESSERLAA